MRKRTIVVISISLLIFAKVDAQVFHIPDSVAKATRENYISDSLNFIRNFNRLLSSENWEEIEKLSISLDVLKYTKLIKLHSNEIVQKLNDVKRKNTHHYKLLSLCNPPDSIREEILKTSCTLCEARLGDSTSIAHYINQYASYRDREDWEYNLDGIRNSLKILLSFDSQTVLDIVFNDIQSTRLIKVCDNPFDSDTTDCFWKSYTYLYSIIEVLQMKHLDEPFLNHHFIYPLTKISYQKDNIPPPMPGFFKTLEDFILKEYGYMVRINVPFVIARESY